MDFSTIEITSKKVRANNVDFSTIEITSKKVRGNSVDFSIGEVASKKYVIWSSTNRHNIDVESTSIQHGLPIGLEKVFHKRGYVLKLF